MTLNALFRASAVASALALAACGGDINISEGDITENSNNSTTTNVTNEGDTTGGDAGGDTGGDAGVDTAVGSPEPTLSQEISTALGQDVEVRSLSGRLTPASIASGNVTSQNADDNVITLTNDTIYALSGPVFVGGDNEDSVTLEIEPGTVIIGASSSGSDYLVVSRGSKISANGTADAPIIMTSKDDVLGDQVGPGQWGGLVILGNASSTKCPQDGSDCALQVEGAAEGAVFGGSTDDDDSGNLNYVVVKYAGNEIAPGNELNGITFGGVGSATEVSHVQVHSNADDGVEFFGGSVNAKYLVLTNNQDDSVDWDNGYKGKIQYVYVEHPRDGGEANRGIEGDGDGGEGEAFSFPHVANMTIVGNQFDTADKDSEGVLLRDQTSARLMNFLITGPAGMGECFDVDVSDGDATVEANLGNGNIELTDSYISCEEPVKDYTGEDTTVNLLTYVNEETRNNTVVDFADADARNNLGINNDGSLTTASPLLTEGGDPSTLDGFFDAATFVGAIGETDWRQGWAFGFNGGIISVASSASGCPAGTTTIASVDGETNTCEVRGTITSDLTLTAGNHYALSGAVFVGGDNTDSAELTIEPGVIVYGSGGNDYLVVSRGSTIVADGTADAPITMTSAQHAADPTTLANGEAGQWGGLVILGNGTSTKCPQDGSDCALQVEGVQEGAVFGGNDDEDSSGTLRYVRVMHGGFEIAPGNELNGITFGGVGSGTTVEYVQVHKNADDGVEFFGGAVSAKYLVLTGIQDDSVDWDNGYKGKMQFVLVKHASDDSDANRGIEGDGDGGTGTEFSNPTVANMTIIGNNFDTADSDSEGVLLRDQTSAKLYNFVVTGPAGMGECFDVDVSDGDATVEANLTDGDIVFANSAISCDEPVKEYADVNLTDFIEGQEGSVITTDAVVDGYTTTITSVTPADLSADDSFFMATDFIGAVGSTDWTAGWAVGLD